MAAEPESPAGPARRYLRFERYERILHGLLMLSFLGLSLTGLPLLFAEAGWGARMVSLVGGYAVTGVLHRLFAIVLIGVFVAHLARVLHKLYVRKELGILWGPDSLVPQPRDVVQMAQHFRYFLGRGPRPRFDRFTYWEKFDYWAVFWGMGIIGGSGLLLWFPWLFSRWVPGWVFNVAFVVHGEEALLATMFIFTVHFFNGHLRPEKFPMDMVIFTGRVTEEELRHERPAEYARLLESGDLATVTELTPSTLAIGRVVGSLAVATGLILVGLIVFAVVTH
jgi:cytochrome b subunit of formate dehydrogenase